MNKRQKKKLFKRMHGYNPPKKTKPAAVSDSDTIEFEFDCNEQMEKVRMMLRGWGAAIGRVAEAIRDGFKGIGEALQMGCETEELPIVQTTQILTESRGRRGWTRKRR